MNMKLRLAAQSSMVAMGLVCAMPAFAQAAPADDDSASSENEDIVVTGSLIQRPNNASVSPIVTVTDDLIRQTGNANLEDALNQFPSFTPSQNAATGGQGGGGRATVNLHGLGSNRNLVLLDGRRLPLSDINGNVDINILPESVIGGVDVITGGASAIYGSDAMSGVVNFKSVRPFDGVRMDAQYGLSERGDAQRFNASAAFGTSFADDRGHLVFSVSYSQRDPLAGSARSYYLDKIPSSFIGTGTYVPNATNLPDQAVLNGIFATYGVTSNISRTLNLGFNNDASLFVQTGAVNYRGPRDNLGYAIIGGNVRMPVGAQIDILNGFERHSAFAKFDYDLTDGITAYGQFMYVDTTTHTESGGSLTQIGSLTTIPVTNPFIPAALRTILASRPNPNANFLWNGRYVGIPDKNWDENYTVQQYIGGLRGDITAGWSFDAFVSYDESLHTQTLNSAVLKSRVQSLLSAADGGNSLCAGGFNPFGDTNARSLSQACVAYLTKSAVTTENLSQTQVQAQINGELFDLGAGPIQLALLADWRRNTYVQTPDSDLAAQNIEAVVASALARGNISVKEAAVQIDIPLLSDRAFFQELGIGAAARVSDYSTTGSVTSYEFDARWRPVSSLLFRASYQRAVRAPNIGELFSPPSGVQVALNTPPAALGDPCDIRSLARTGATGAGVRGLCLAQGIPLARIDNYTFPTTATGGIITGNLGLTPERATTYNLGFVLNSPITSGLLSDITLSVDYYNIKISNVISVVPGLTTLSKCYNQDGSNPTYDVNNQFCQLLSRDVSGDLSIVRQPYLNLGGLNTDGVEIQLNWTVPAPFLSESGRLYLNSGIGYTAHYEVQTLPGTPFQDFAGTSTIGRALPKWKALTTVGYRSDAFGFGMRWRYQNAMRDVSAVTTPLTPGAPVPAYNLFDLFANVQLNDTVEFRVGVNNLFDRGLPLVASSQNLTDAGQYDAIGRAFYIGARVNF